MEYTVKAANGDAGEYFFAYQIAHVLKWPCRLLDVDIGIDAQVELLDEERMSTARFIAIQVKAREEEGPNYRYVSKAQLAYWQEIDVPVFVVLVNLKAKPIKMYLHEVSKSHKYSITPKGSVRIDFDLKKDIFNSATATRFSESLVNVAMHHIQPWLDKVNRGSDEILEYLEGPVDNKDTLLELMRSRVALKENLAHAFSLVRSMHAGEDKYHDAKLKLDDGLKQLAEVMKSANIHIDEGENYHEVNTFFEEQR
jgi:hypothetical protein